MGSFQNPWGTSIPSGERLPAGCLPAGTTHPLSHPLLAESVFPIGYLILQNGTKARFAQTNAKQPQERGLATGYRHHHAGSCCSSQQAAVTLPASRLQEPCDELKGPQGTCN